MVPETLAVEDHQTRREKLVILVYERTHHEEDVWVVHFHTLQQDLQWGVGQTVTERVRTHGHHHLGVRRRERQFLLQGLSLLDVLVVVQSQRGLRDDSVGMEDALFILGLLFIDSLEHQMLIGEDLTLVYSLERQEYLAV